MGFWDSSEAVLRKIMYMFLAAMVLSSPFLFAKLNDVEEMGMTVMEASALVEELNETYDKLHRVKEQLFWETKMGLSQDYDAYNKSEAELQSFTQDPKYLKMCREALSKADEADATTLKGWIHFFEANGMEDEEAKKLKEEITRMESDLAKARGEMKLGYDDPESGEFVEASSVELALKISSHDDPKMREACYRGMESIESFVLDKGFCDIVRARNQMARRLGYKNFYEYKLKITEGLSMEKLFKWLDELEERSRAPALRYLDEVKKGQGGDALRPWNFGYYTSGDSIKDLDPYTPFSESVLRWGKSFAGMGVTFQGAKMQLDLVDRKGKYENGFCHAPVASYLKKNGEDVKAEVNFTSNAVPGQLGSGNNAAVTLFHEGGHAAHFANIKMGAPCFSQEFAPSSVATAETQSMFFDSLLSDADWLTRYANVPWGVVETVTRRQQPLKAMALRRMLVVPFAEREIYQLSDEEITPDKLMSVAARVEMKLTLLERSPRPLYAIPHLLESESSAYYHGYVLAEAAVYQTRDFFTERDGHIVDNPKVGPDMSEAYWRLGNSITFEAFVERMTGTEFSVDAFVKEVSMTADEAVALQRARLDKIHTVPTFSGKVDMDLQIDLVHGDKVISSSSDGGFEVAAEKFKHWIEGLESCN